MPTGYTAYVQDGTITEFKDFALLCARAFGALVTMRDEPNSTPIPERLEPSNKYYDDQIAECEARLATLKAMSPDEVRVASLDAHAKAMEAWHERRRKRLETKRRYLAMLDKVKAWHPPTPDHSELAAFMIRQLQESIEVDTSGKWDNEPITLAGEAWRQAEIRETESQLNYAIKHRAEEIARTAERNEWLSALRASLDGVQA